MSISLGGVFFGSGKKLDDALAAARRAGLVVVAAAGQYPPEVLNVGGSRLPDMPPTFPGSSPDTICAAGCDSRHEPLRGGFYGKEVDVTDPAVNMWIPRTKLVDRTERYHVERSEGTSYATALTAASCALWQSHHGRDALIATFGRSRLLTVFRSCLHRSADRPAGWGAHPVLGDGRGAGVLDVERLLATPLPAPSVVEQLDAITPWWLHRRAHPGLRRGRRRQG